jgi:hypothetical protein
MVVMVELAPAAPLLAQQAQAALEAGAEAVGHLIMDQVAVAPEYTVKVLAE